MNNPDILRLILSRVDNETLSKIASTPLWLEAKPVLEEDYFWYLRSQELLGRSLEVRINTDWKEIYGLLEALKLKQDIGTINSLVAVQVITEAFGSNIWDSPGKLWSPWTRVTNIQGLKYLIDNGYIKIDPLTASPAATYAAIRGSQEFIDFLLILPGVDTTQILNNAIRGAITGDKLELYQYLWVLGSTIPGTLPLLVDIPYMFLEVATNGGPKIAEYLLRNYNNKITGIELYESVLATIRYNRPEVLKIIYDMRPESRTLLSSKDYKTYVLSAAESGRLELLRVLVERADNIAPVRDILNAAIRGGVIEVVRYALTLVSPATKNNQALVLAMKSGEEGVISLLLQDPRIDPNSNLREVVLTVHQFSNKSTIQKFNTLLEAPDNLALLDFHERDRGARVDILIQDKRTDVERMDIPTLRLVVWSLRSLLTSAVNGFRTGNNLAGGEHITAGNALRYVLTTMEKGNRTDIYSSLLGFLIVKRPSAREIFRWLAQSNSPELVLQAAKSVLNKRLRCPVQAIPIRELILALIYPSMTLRESYEILKSESISKEIIILSCRLVGTYIGYRDER